MLSKLAKAVVNIIVESLIFINKGIFPNMLKISEAVPLTNTETSDYQVFFISSTVICFGVFAAVLKDQLFDFFGNNGPFTK